MSDPMDDLPRQKLCELIAAYGRSVCDDPRRCEGLLRDYCGAYKREIHVLVSALKERVAADLLGSQGGIPREVLFARLTKRLRDDLGLAEEAARWAVESWALALGVIASAPQESPPKDKATERKPFTERKQEPVKEDKAAAERRPPNADDRPAVAEKKPGLSGVRVKTSPTFFDLLDAIDRRAGSGQPAAAEKKREPVKQGKAAAEQPHLHRPTDPVPPPPPRDPQPGNPGGRQGSNWVQWVLGLALFLLVLLSVNGWKLPFARPVAHTAPSVSQPAPPTITSPRECYDFATREYGACGGGDSDSGTPAEGTPPVTDLEVPFEPVIGANAR